MPTFEPKTLDDWKDIDAKMETMGFAPEVEASIFDRRYIHKASSCVAISLYPVPYRAEIRVTISLQWELRNVRFEYSHETSVDVPDELNDQPLRKSLEDVIKLFTWIRENPFPVSFPPDLSRMSVIGFTTRRYKPHYTFMQGFDIGIGVSSSNTGTDKIMDVFLKYLYNSLIFHDVMFWKKIPIENVTPKTLTEFYEDCVRMASDPKNPFYEFYQSQFQNDKTLQATS